MPEADWIVAGLLDPESGDAEDRRALLAWLDEHGFTTEEMVEAARRQQLHALAGERRLQLPPALTPAEVAERCGTTIELVERVWLAAGFPPLERDRVAFHEDELPLFAMVAAAVQLFGEDNVMAFARVMGAAMARIAEAADAMFLADVEGPLRAGGAPDVELAKLIDEGMAMLAALPELLAPLFRRHAAAAIERSRLIRSASGSGYTGPDRIRVAVGFADLVGWTALAERYDPRTLAAAIGRFERDAAERAVAAGVRLVKSIGDAVMLVGHDPVAVVEVLAGLAATVDADEVLTGMRGGVAFGEVLAREGDYVGPTVNLAARITKEAPPGRIAVNPPVAAALESAGRPVEHLPARAVRGLDEPVVLALVARE